LHDVQSTLLLSILAGPAGDFFFLRRSPDDHSERGIPMAAAPQTFSVMYFCG